MAAECCISCAVNSICVSIGEVCVTIVIESVALGRIH